MRLVAILSALCLTSPALADRAPRENYILRCAGCHGMDGTGSQIGGVPTFHDGAITTLANDDEARTYLMHVPGVVGASLSNAEIAEVMNWVNSHWGTGPAPDFTEVEVNRRRAIPISDVVRFRRTLADRLKAEGKTLPDYPWP